MSDDRRDPAKDSAFQRCLEDKRRFTLSLQIDPRSDTSMGDLYQLLDAVRDNDQLGAIDINEPSRRPAQSPVTVAATAQRHGVEGIPHITCRRDHLSIVNEILAAVTYGGLRKVLVMSGDPPEHHLRQSLGRSRRLEQLGIERRLREVDPDGADELIGLLHRALNNPDGDILELLKLLDKIRQGEYLGTRGMKPVRFAIGVVFDHTKRGRALEREKDRLRAKRDARANSLWGQPVFTIGQMHELLESIQGIWDRPVLPGIWPLENREKALRLNRLVPGVEVPQEVIDQLPEASDDPQEAERRRAVGRRLARELLDQIRSERLCAGAYLVAPLRQPWDTLKMLNGH